MGKSRRYRAEAWGPGLGHPANGAVRSETGQSWPWVQEDLWVVASCQGHFTAQISCQVQLEELRDLTLAWRHRAPGGGASLQPATHQPALTSPRHRVWPASICCLLPPSPGACLFFFQNHRLPRRQSSKRGGVLETSLCPLQPHHASQCWRGWCGRLGPPAGRRHPWAARISSTLGSWFRWWNPEQA